MADDTFQQLADGKVRILALVAVALARSCRCIIQLDGQKAFLTGKLKTKGNMMFATKLEGVLKVRFDDIVHYHLGLTRHVQAAKAKAKLGRVISMSIAT